MLVLGLIDAALELVPPELVNHPVIRHNAQMRKKPPNELLLDESRHLKAIQTLSNAERRGRPDIAHRSLLVALDSVLAKEEQLDVFLHTYLGEIILIKAGTRLPRRTPRFIGLIEQLLLNKRVPLQGEPLLQVIPRTLEAYLKELKPSHIVLLSEKGTPMSPTELAKTLLNESKPLVLVGSFAHGEVRSDLMPLVDQQVSLDPDVLPSSTIIGMLIHSMEQVLDLSTQRFQKTK